jgi:FKBP-type peptidyl-prolyl cis-trans isomerase FkpA
MPIRSYGTANDVKLLLMKSYLPLLSIVLVSCASPPPDTAESKAYLEKAAAAPGATQSPSGLIYRELRAGTGTSPHATDTVKVNYRGTLVNGKQFDASEGIKFPLNQVIPCWTEGVQKMKVGGKSELVCPSSIGYGDRGNPPEIPGGATLIFEIELLSVAP